MKIITQYRTYALLVYLLTFVTTSQPTTTPPFPSDSKKVKNCIIMVPDGCGTAHMTISRWFKGAPLAQDGMRVGLVNTYSANSAITGSAAAASAFATGHKAWEDDSRAKCISILPDSVVNPTPQKLPPDLAWRPVATILEASRMSGRSTGLVATSVIPHATPAAFSAHWHDRENFNVLIKQQIFQNIDVVFAGGLTHLLPVDVSGGSRNDGENLTLVLQERGYTQIRSKSELASLPTDTKKVWGMFNSGSFQSEIDRQYFAPDQPSLAECTKKAIELLSKNNKGFFLMVEGSQVDWFSHSNDPVGVVSEYLAFDSAVSVALNFARNNGSTEVLIFPDHDNGGMSLGLRGDAYTSMPPALVVNPLKACTITCRALLDSLIRYSSSIGPVDWNIVASHLVSLMHIDPITAEDTMITIPASVNNKTTAYEDVAKIGTIVSKRAHIGWTTNGHTGNNVPMYSHLLQSNRMFDNTDIAKYCEYILDLNLQKTTDTLMVSAAKLFNSDEYTLTIDSSGVNDGRGSISVQKGSIFVSIPFFKDYFKAGNYTFKLPGIVIYSLLNNTVYLPSVTKILFDSIDPNNIQYTALKPLLLHRESTVSFYNLSGRKLQKKSIPINISTGLFNNSFSSNVAGGYYIIQERTPTLNSNSSYSIVR